MRVADEPVEVKRLTRLNEYGPDDLFVCCASFEDRCLSSISTMGIDYRTNFAVIFVMTLASFVTWLIYQYMLVPSESNVFYIIFNLKSPPDLSYLRTIAFILVIASLVLDPDNVQTVF